MKVLAALVLLAGIVQFADAQNGFFSNLFGRFGRQGFNNNNNNNRDCGGCPCSGPNSGRYLVTWLLPNCKKFTQGEAIQYCQRNGMKAISLDSNAKAEETFRLLAKDTQRYYWTGGKVNHRDQSVTWPNGQTSRNIPFWSPTGARRVPQPDNREGNEFCLAVLNNFYSDGIKYHDVSCHHVKPTICEA
ncbi:C-type lectin BfL-1 isoform X2 [Lepeophtheirus salmonis]|uniref:C-type lectin domain-containing protein n=3 Tax=Lepeophtheirus salmonis TaxID=72036 RepID=A0A0K2SVQ0_LEPSM|nr:uncharacterized protein LOC121118406 [Lepeophtheirus salmonis]